MTRARLGAELSRAAQLMQTGRTREAAIICRQVLKRDKRDVDAYQMLGLIESMIGRFDDAVNWFQRGLRVNPRAPMLLCGLVDQAFASRAFAGGRSQRNPSGVKK